MADKDRENVFAYINAVLAYKDAYKRYDEANTIQRNCQCAVQHRRKELPTVGPNIPKKAFVIDGRILVIEYVDEKTSPRVTLFGQDGIE